jgi:hypothetical protein
MIITILAEPRSGSSNLTNWFNFQKNINIIKCGYTTLNFKSYEK